MAKRAMSDKQRMILEYIKKQILEKGYPPSVREICQAVSLRSTSSVHAHLDTLEKNGYMESKDLFKPPFDKPGPFTDLFSDPIQDEIVGAINAVRNNATVVKPA